MPPRPNILFIFTDQQRSDTIAALGNTAIKTPNLDRLVREGVAFTNAFSPSPICVPARSCLHYGQYPGKTKCWGNARPMPGDRDSYADMLTRSGYDTLAVGKCHFTPDRGALRGFRKRWKQEEAPKSIEEDDYLQFLQASPFRQVRDVHGAWREMLYMPQASPLPEAYHPSTWVADRTVDFIKQHGEEGGGSPWMAFCSFIHPHPPYSPPHPWDKMYDPDEVGDPYLPDDYLVRQHIYMKAQLYHYYIDPPVSRTLWRMIRSRYYGCVSYVDKQVGRVMRSLEDSGQLDNTLIIFSSDHGDMLGDLGLIGKEDMYGSSVRVPLLMRTGSDIHRGLRVDVPVSLVDISATIVKAAGLEVPDTFDGQSLVDIADNSDSYSDRIVISQVYETDRAAYMSADCQYKYSYSARDDREYLYDYVDDPCEDHNLVADPAHAPVRSRLRDALFSYLVDTGQHDSLDESLRDWRHWSVQSFSKPRSTSNVPCMWDPDRNDPG